MGFQTTKFDQEKVSLTGPHTVQGDTRYATFRLFDATRTVAQGRAPGTGPATIPVNPVGSVPVSCARWHMKIPLTYEELGNLSPIIGPNSVIELMTSGMIQDNLWLNYQGDNIVATIGQLTGTNAFGFQVPFQVPAGNKSQLNMLGTGNLITLPWSNPGSPILQQLMAIKAAFMQLSGYPLQHVWINSLTWYRVLVNTEVRNTAGSANTPFAEYDNVPEMGADGEPTGDFEAILRGDPTITWHITDEVLVTNSDIDPSYATAPSTATLTKMVPDNNAFFMTAPSSEWSQMYHGGEYVVENPGMPGVLRRGYHFWHEYVTQPSAVDLIGLLNCVPLLYVPRVVAPATVSGF